MITKLPSTYYCAVRVDTLGALSGMVSCPVLPSKEETLTKRNSGEKFLVCHSLSRAGWGCRQMASMHGAERQFNGQLISDITGELRVNVLLKRLIKICECSTKIKFWKFLGTVVTTDKTITQKLRQ